MAVGMKFDAGTNLLFVAGGATGMAYIYDIETGESVERTLAPGFINDVTLTPQGAWFTNSAAAELYFIPVGPGGEIGAVEVLTLSGPAADAGDQFNLNGIASAKGGRVLFVAHSGNGEIYTVNPETGASALVEGVSVPNVDGILVQGQRLWAVQNFSNQISRIDLANNFSSGVIEDVITSTGFNTPATAALFGNTLAAVNAQFILPDTEYEVVLVPARL
jgi:sugar lactone lactonase YvrE